MMGRFLPFFLLIVALTACTRQASGPFEPVNAPQDVSVAVTATPQEDDVSAGIDATLTAAFNADAEETPLGFDPLETSEAGFGDDLTPTDDELPPLGFDDLETLPTTEAGDESGIGTTGEDLPLIFTLAPTLTPTFDPLAQSTEVIDVTVTDETGNLDETDSTPVAFITPGSPNDLMVIESPTPNTLDPLPPTPTDLPQISGNQGGDQPSISIEDVDEACLYTVRRGDTIFRIAMAQKTTVADLRSVNSTIANSDTIFPGQKLILPNCDTDGAPAQPTSTATAASSGANNVTHVVKSGESLFLIARFYGVTIAEIVAANNLPNPDRLSVGQSLIIPQPD